MNLQGNVRSPSEKGRKGPAVAGPLQGCEIPSREGKKAKRFRGVYVDRPKIDPKFLDSKIPSQRRFIARIGYSDTSSPTVDDNPAITRAMRS